MTDHSSSQQDSSIETFIHELQREIAKLRQKRAAYSTKPLEETYDNPNHSSNFNSTSHRLQLPASA